MKGQKIPSLLISLFHISATLWGFTEQETVTGLFSKDCILPCPFPPGDDEVIYWSKEGKIVHRYYYQKDQLEGQDPNYRHRTQLFHENIPRGNASLKLSDLTLTDEGTYKCYVGTLQTPVNVEVMLHVRVSSHYALEYQKIDTEMMLKCYAFLTYPAPHISWVQGNTSIQETHREETKAGVLYSLRSDQKITNTNDTYYCRILLPYEEWAAEWKMQERLSNVEGNSTAIPCESNSNITNTEGLRVVWSLNRNAVLASCNGTCHSYQPRVHINQSDFSLMFDNLTTSDSGEYLCNISTPRYTKLTVRTLQIENSGNTGQTVQGVIAAVVLFAVLLFIFSSCICKKFRSRGVMSRCSYTRRKPLSAHTGATEITAEENKEFLHLPY